MEIEFHEHLNEDISIIGTISNMPWQHLIDFSDSHPNIQYLDLESGDQIVIYSKNPIDCSDKIKITGKVIKVVGKSKRPGDKSKDDYVEFQVVVDNWECFN